jgi:hypothetical protein
MATASDIERPSPAAFVQNFVDVDQPERLTSERLSGGQFWLARLASATGDEMMSQLAQLGSSDHLVAREIRVRLGQPTTSKTGVVVALRWEDDRRPNLFPVLDGNFEVAALGPDRSRVVLYASYRPPFDQLGRALDHTLFYDVAESMIRTFLRKVAETLQEWPAKESLTNAGQVVVTQTEG